MAERIARDAAAPTHGAIPVDDAVPIARQIAEALEYAHERGIVHRDLKPANVKITSNGLVKLLDFGLAKAMEGDASAADVSSSPTISRIATEAKLILGTAAYMPPEQAKGKAVDRRADIWAFGCVVYEMLSGRRAFDGETVTDLLAAVVRDTPDWTSVPPSTPAPISDLFRRCLTKEPKQRLRDIGDARIVLEETQSGTSTARGLGPPPAEVRTVRNATWRRVAPWVLAGLAVLVAAVPVARYWTATPTAPVIRFTLAPPTEGDFARGVGSAVVLSPDGTQIAYVLHTGDKDQLYLRRLDRDQPTVVSGEPPVGNPGYRSPSGERLQAVRIRIRHKRKGCQSRSAS